jgi:hypothetical protein
MRASTASRNVARRWGAGTAAVARILIAANEPRTGVSIAEAVGVTQPRVSQVIKQFATKHAVRATDDGYVADAAVLLGLYGQRARPLLREPESYWYSTRVVREQSASILNRARETSATVAFSADLAPDLLVPWRHPTLTIVYTDVAPEMIVDGFVPAEGRGDASIIMRWTGDASLLAPAPPWPSAVDGVPLTDPVQQWSDLLDLGGEDRHEAANRLRDAIIDRSLSRAP